MKLLIASDIHGDIEAAKSIINIFKAEGCDRIFLLGDLLYFGPRNSLTENYDPQGVIKLLNENKEYILAVRGNCDAEVDQMVLDFPIMADYCYLSLDGLSVFATHGHHFNTQTPPPLREGEILLHGHTHVSTVESFGNENLYVNPGSVSIPKENTPKGYILYDNGRLLFKTLSGETFREYVL